MRVALLTQDDPFYLAESIAEFIGKIEDSNHELVVSIVSSASPYGKSESFFKKSLKTFRTFGINFFTHYSITFIVRKFFLRRSVVKELNKKNIKTWILGDSLNTDININKLKEFDLDIIVIIAGNQILRSEVLKAPRLGVINAHSSLLPEYRGLMPTFWVLQHNEKQTGVTVFFLTEGIDDGAIINQQIIEITRDMTHRELVIKSKEVANKLLIEALNSIEMGNSFQLEGPTPNQGSYYKFPNRRDVDEFIKNGRRFY